MIRIKPLQEKRTVNSLDDAEHAEFLLGLFRQFTGVGEGHKGHETGRKS